MLQLKLRDSLVRARVALINGVRFTLKSLGYPVSNPSSGRFHKLVLNEVPESIREMIAHNVAAIAELTERIKALNTSISRLAAERYPQTICLQQVSGVGPITSLYFVLKIGNPGRFQRTRDIGAFLGLCPKRDQSGETDKELRISKCGDRYLRRLLVSAAQYILGPFGADSALREHGLRLAQEGTARAKKRESSPYCYSRSGNPVNLMNPSTPWLEPVYGGYAPPNPTPLAAAGVRGELLNPTEDGRFGTIAI